MTTHTHPTGRPVMSPAGRSGWLQALAKMPRARLAVPSGLYRTVHAALLVAALLLGWPTDSSSVRAASVQVSAPCPQGAPQVEAVSAHD